MGQETPETGPMAQPAESRQNLHVVVLDKDAERRMGQHVASSLKVGALLEL